MASRAWTLACKAGLRGDLGARVQARAGRHHGCRKRTCSSGQTVRWRSCLPIRWKPVLLPRPPLGRVWRQRSTTCLWPCTLPSACTRGGSGESKRLADARACRGRALAVGESRYFPRIRFGNHPDGHWLWRAPPSHDQLSRGPTRTRNH